MHPIEHLALSLPIHLRLSDITCGQQHMRQLGLYATDPSISQQSLDVPILCPKIHYFSVRIYIWNSQKAGWQLLNRHCLVLKMYTTNASNRERNYFTDVRSFNSLDVWIPSAVTTSDQYLQLLNNILKANFHFPLSPAYDLKPYTYHTRAVSTLPPSWHILASPLQGSPWPSTYPPRVGILQQGVAI